MLVLVVAVSLEVLLPAGVVGQGIPNPLSALLWQEEEVVRLAARNQPRQLPVCPVEERQPQPKLLLPLSSLRLKPRSQSRLQHWRQSWAELQQRCISKLGGH